MAQDEGGKTAVRQDAWQTINVGSAVSDFLRWDFIERHKNCAEAGGLNEPYLRCGRGMIA